MVCAFVGRVDCVEGGAGCVLILEGESRYTLVVVVK